MLRGEINPRHEWDIIKPVFCECGSHGLIGEDAFVAKGYWLLETDGGKSKKALAQIHAMREYEPGRTPGSRNEYQH